MCILITKKLLKNAFFSIFKAHFHQNFQQQKPDVPRVLITHTSHEKLREASPSRERIIAGLVVCILARATTTVLVVYAQQKKFPTFIMIKNR